MDRVALPVIAGLAIGVAFIIVFSQMSFQTSIPFYTSGLIDESYVELERGNNKLVIDIMLRNSTVIELLEGRHVSLSAIGDMTNRCSFGSCARVYLYERDSAGNLTGEGAGILVDYTNNRIASIRYTDGW